MCIKITWIKDHILQEFRNCSLAGYFWRLLNMCLHFIVYLNTKTSQEFWDSLSIREDKNNHTVHHQYLGCWCHGYTRSQGISSYDIDVIYPKNQYHCSCHGDTRSQGISSYEIDLIFPTSSRRPPPPANINIRDIGVFGVNRLCGVVTWSVKVHCDFCTISVFILCT